MFQEERYITMEQIISGISDKLKEKVTKKQFMKECGIFLIGVAFFPALLNLLINKSRLIIEDDKVYLDNELIIDRREE